MRCNTYSNFLSLKRGQKEDLAKVENAGVSNAQRLRACTGVIGDLTSPLYIDTLFT